MHNGLVVSMQLQAVHQHGWRSACNRTQALGACTVVYQAYQQHGACQRSHRYSRFGKIRAVRAIECTFHTLAGVANSPIPPLPNPISYFGDNLCSYVAERARCRPWNKHNTRHTP